MHVRYVLSSSPGPTARCTSIPAPIIRYDRSFSCSDCMPRDRQEAGLDSSADSGMQISPSAISSLRLCASVSRTARGCGKHGIHVSVCSDESRWPRKLESSIARIGPFAFQCLLFAGLALDRRAYVDLWQGLEADPTVDEVIRNFVVRQLFLDLDGVAISVK